MDEMFRRSKLPPSFSLVRRGKTTIMIRNEYNDRLLSQGIEDPHRFAQDPQSKATFFRGRGEVISVPIQGTQGERMVIRHYHHGGFFSRITKDIFWGTSRPAKELMASEKMRSLGLPTSEVLAVVRHRVFGPFYRGDIISKEIHAIDLVEYLARFKERSSEEELREKREVVAKMAGVIRKMHEKGLYHGDLHLKNILIQRDAKGEMRIYLLDLDKTKVKNEMGLRQRMRNLARLNRSVEKLRSKGGWITKSDKLRFFMEYAKGDERIGLNRKKYIRKCSAFERIHKLGWRFSSQDN